MKARYSWYLFIFLSFSSITILFNNCAGANPDKEISAESATEPQLEVLTNFSGKMTANFQYVSTDGKAWGYAVDNNDKTKALKILFYADGAVGTGTFIGEAIARDTGVGTYAGHYFTFKVPDSLANGKYNKLWAYAHEAKLEYLIKPSPVTFVSYTPKAEAFYNQNIGPFVASQCTRCHSWSYQTLFFGPLMNSLPITGGTASNNRLIRKMSGLDGHSGGNFCSGGLNSGFCMNIQQWWTAEFQ